MWTRHFFCLQAFGIIFFGAIISSSAATTPRTDSVDAAETALAKLEAADAARLGVYALDTGSGAEIRHWADERFPVCSTFKVILAAAILKRSAGDPGFLSQRIRYQKSDLVTYSPIAEKQVEGGMTISELSAAALQYSDNTAGNLLIDILGGPAAVTAFARSLGNKEFRLDRRETALNTAIPGDLRDTATPASMGRSLQALTLGDALPAAQREQLNQWMLGNTTGAKRIRAATPAGWKVADKTGSGDYGTVNDLAVIWPPNRKPIILAIYVTHEDPKAKWRDDTIAAAARVALKALGGI